MALAAEPTHDGVPMSMVVGIGICLMGIERCDYYKL